MSKARFHSNAAIHASVQTQLRAPSVTAAPSGSKKPNALDSGRFGELSFTSRAWTAIVPDGTDYAELLDPAYWRQNAKRMSARDTIDVVNDAFTFYAKFLVISCDPSTGMLEVRELYRRDFDPPRVEDQDINGFSVSWAGGFDKWMVTRASDGHVMKKSIGSCQEARYFIQTELTPRLAAGRAS